MPEIEVTHITVTFAGKGSVGDFQNAERGITFEAKVPEGMSFEIASEAAFAMARRAVAHEWRELVRQQMDMEYVVRYREGESRVRDYVTGKGAFGYFCLIDPAMAEAFVQDTVAEVLERQRQLAEERAAEKAVLDTIVVSDDPLSPDYEPTYDPDEDDDGDGDFDGDDDWDDEDLSLDDDEPEFDDGASYDDPEPDDEDTLEAVVAEVMPDADPAEVYPESTDIPNAGLN